MDVILIITSVLSFCVFIGVLAVLFRVQKKQNPLVTVFIASVTGWCLSGLVFAYFGGWSIESYILVFGMYSGCVVLFVFAIFSVFEASLTVKFLSVIASHTGVTFQYIEKNFGRTDIVTKRLERLLESGDIMKTEGGYQITKRQSFFRLREMFLEWYWVCFPK